MRTKYTLLTTAHMKVNRTRFDNIVNEDVQQVHTSRHSSRNWMILYVRGDVAEKLLSAKSNVEVVMLYILKLRNRVSSWESLYFLHPLGAHGNVLHNSRPLPWP